MEHLVLLWDPAIKDVARFMTKLWDRSIRRTFEIKGWLITDKWAHAAPEIRTTTCLLSWMELPLVLQTGNPGTGKWGLFDLARHFEQTANAARGAR